MKIKSITLVLLVCSFNLVKAQGDIDDLVKGGTADVNYLIQGYSEPLLKAFGYGLNQGWYNTAKPHKIAGVDITVPISLITIPSKAMTFQVDNTKLTTLERLSGPSGTPQSGSAQTIFGENKTTAFRLKSNGAQISMPGGLNLKDEIGINAVPVPMAQVGFGLPKGTDLKLRFVPKTGFGDGGSVNMFGIGVMHDVKQWIPVIKNFPFDLSGFVGYTKLNVDFVSSSGTSSSSTAKYEVSATTIQGLISKKLSVLTVYAGVGANIANTDLGITGKFDTDNNSATPDETMNIVAKASSSGPRATIGMRLKLAVLTIHGDYTLQAYNALNVGLGISVR